MNATSSLSTENPDPLLFDPFASQFLPDRMAEGKSHFQAAFLFLSHRRAQAMKDFYAYCRLVDDIADEDSLRLSIPQRELLLQRIETWLETLPSLSHPYWDRLRESILLYQIPIDSMKEIIAGCRRDLQEGSIHFQTWSDLDRYAYQVAGCVGICVLAILGEPSSQKINYAENLGRFVQYLNIMRDLEEDLQQQRLYIPQDFLMSLGLDSGLKNIPAPLKEQIREELYTRALEFRRRASPLSWRSLPAELMVGIYRDGSQKFWRKGISRRLTKIQKILSLMRTVFWFSVWPRRLKNLK